MMKDMKSSWAEGQMSSIYHWDEQKYPELIWGALHGLGPGRYRNSRLAGGCSRLVETYTPAFQRSKHNPWFLPRVSSHVEQSDGKRTEGVMVVSAAWILYSILSPGLKGLVQSNFGRNPNHLRRRIDAPILLGEWRMDWCSTVWC